MKRELTVSAFQTTSLSDWDGKVVSVIYTQGCNWDCSFCHNRELIPVEKQTCFVDCVDFCFEYLANNLDFIDGVVITGGEPTGNMGLLNLMQRIKELGLLVKLDTNGSNPEALEFLIKQNVIDYIAMDIKEPLIKERYEETVGKSVDIRDIKKSIDLIRMSGIPYEFRTTVIKDHHTVEDIEEISKSIKWATKYVLQPCTPENMTPAMALMETMKKVASEHVSSVLLRMK